MLNLLHKMNQKRLHGLLEGGATYITILGNEAANLGKEDFQKEMGRAHILAPQSTYFWMDKSGREQLIDGKINSDGTSYYTKLLHELIQSYKEKVGAKKVIIAGGSNGGYKGMILAREYGTEYDGYMLICEAMENRFVTDEDIQKLKNFPLYFIYSTKAPLVIPEENEIPTIKRSKAAGATNLQVAVFDEVLDTSATIQTEMASRMILEDIPSGYHSLIMRLLVKTVCLLGTGWQSW